MVGVCQIEGDSSLNLAASSVLVSSLTRHCSPENPEAEACVSATGCLSEASGVRTSKPLL